MLTHHRLPHLKWRTLEKEAQGLIYGAILVLSLLMAIESNIDRPFRPALILFGSVLAMALARALASLISHALETGERMLRPLGPSRCLEGKSSCTVRFTSTILFDAGIRLWLALI